MPVREILIPTHVLLVGFHVDGDAGDAVKSAGSHLYVAVKDDRFQRKGNLGIVPASKIVGYRMILRQGGQSQLLQIGQFRKELFMISTDRQILQTIATCKCVNTDRNRIGTNHRFFSLFIHFNQTIPNI